MHRKSTFAGAALVATFALVGAAAAFSAPSAHTQATSTGRLAIYPYESPFGPDRTVGSETPIYLGIPLTQPYYPRIQPGLNPANPLGL